MLEHYLTSIRVKLGFNGDFGPGELAAVRASRGAAAYNMQLCFFTRYVALFTAGVIGSRPDLLRALPHGLGIFRLRAAAEKERARMDAERNTLTHIPYYAR
jgi:hypothetical protein